LQIQGAGLSIDLDPEGQSNKQAAGVIPAVISPIIFTKKLGLLFPVAVNNLIKVI